MRWLPHLHNLQRMELFVGTTLRGVDVQQAIYRQCPKFNALSIFNWLDPSVIGQSDVGEHDADTELGSFLSGLPSSSLVSFENIRQCGLRDTFFTGLGKHCEALTEIRLCVEKDAIPSLLLLRRCTQLQKFKLEVAGEQTDENTLTSEVLTELVEWLKDCVQLQVMELLEVGFAPKLLKPLFEGRSVQLQELDVKAQKSWYNMKESRNFHKSLATQCNLKSLSLFGDASEVENEDNETLVASICACTRLRHLKLHGVSELFSEAAVMRILSSLQEIEDLYVHGLGLGDDVLTPVANHPQLRSVCFMGLTRFSFEGLLTFVQNLDQNKGAFELSVNNASTEDLLSDDEISLVRQELKDKVNGRFDYVPLRDPDASDFSVESD